MKADAFTLRGTAEALYREAGGRGDLWAQPEKIREAYMQAAIDFWQTAWRSGNKKVSP